MLAYGSGVAPPAMITLPKRRPFNVDGSAHNSTCGNARWTPANTRRVTERSAIGEIDDDHSMIGKSAPSIGEELAVVRSAGTRAPTKASMITRSAYPSRSAAMPRRPSATHLIPLRVGGAGGDGRTR